MAINRMSIPEREYHKFVESPSRPGEPAIEVSGALSLAPTAFSSTQVVQNIYGSISSVAQNIETQIVSYTIPVGKKLSFSKIEASGSNIGLYHIYIDANIAGSFRTMFGASLSGCLSFSDFSGLGLLVTAGQTIRVKVTNPRPYVGDYEGKILGVLADV